MEISGHTQCFAVLGHPVAHTLSPPIQNAALAAMDLDAVYLPYDVLPEDLLSVLNSMGKMGFGGVNLTIPHKEVAFRGLDRLDPSAELVGAVNTVQFTDAGMVGHSTDGYGILMALEEAFGAPIDGQSIAVIGCGGAGRSIALVCATSGAGGITLWNRNRDRARVLSEEIVRVAPDVLVNVVEEDEGVIAEADIVIQATSLGMKPEDAPPITRASLRASQKVIDTIYVMEETVMMREARAAGADAVNGLGMLLHQGVQSLRIWTGKEPPVEAMRAALRQAVYGDDLKS